jgi:Protein of unknown function (DUF2950)/Glycosyl hydrolase family 65, C-terminal domain
VSGRSIDPKLPSQWHSLSFRACWRGRTVQVGIAGGVVRASLAAGEAMELRLVAQGPDRMTIILGRQAWPMPIPLVRSEPGWRFDTAAGLEEIIDRRIGRNELAAIEFAPVYGDAQEAYAGEDRDGDEVIGYAQKLASTPGQRDGLFWEPGGDPGTTARKARSLRSPPRRPSIWAIAKPASPTGATGSASWPRRARTRPAASTIT